MIIAEIGFRTSSGEFRDRSAVPQSRSPRAEFLKHFDGGVNVPNCKSTFLSNSLHHSARIPWRRRLRGTAASSPRMTPDRAMDRCCSRRRWSRSFRSQTCCRVNRRSVTRRRPSRDAGVSNYCSSANYQFPPMLAQCDAPYPPQIGRLATVVCAPPFAPIARKTRTFHSRCAFRFTPAVD